MYKKINIKIYILFFLSMSLLISQSNSSEISTTIDKTSLSVGDRLHFRVSIYAPKGTECIPPEPEQHLKNLTAKEWNISRKENNQFDSIFIDYILTTYIPETCTIPSLPFVINTQLKSDTLLTNSIPLQLLSVINGPDSTIDIKDLKPQQIAGVAPKWWLWISISVLILVLIVILVLFISKKFKKEKSLPPPVPPYEEAMLALGALHGKRLLEKGLIREYVFELSEIFKRYIERRFSINASEFTTEEMLAWAGVSGLDSKLKNSIEWFFKTTDPVKFARTIPESSIIDRFSNEVMSFLEATRPLQQSSDTESNKDNNSAVQESPAPAVNDTPDTANKVNEVR